MIEDEQAYNFLYGFISLVSGLKSVHCKLEYSWPVYKSYDIRGVLDWDILTYHEMLFLSKRHTY